MKKFFNVNSKSLLRKFLLSTTTFFTAAFLFSSCVRNLYAPSVVYAPQLRDKYEGEFGINANGNAGLQMQTSIELTNFLGVQAQANAMRLHSGDFLAGPNCWWKHKLDDRDVFLIGFSAGYAAGTYQNYRTRATGLGITGIGKDPGYMLYDVYAKWHGTYFQYSIGARLDNKLSAYTGTRFEFLNCSQFRYNTQFFAMDTLHEGQFIPGEKQSVNPRQGYTTLAEVFLGLNFGWQHFHFFVEAQFRGQYTGQNLFDSWKVPGTGVATAGITFMFGNKNLPKYAHGVLVNPNQTQ